MKPPLPPSNFATMNSQLKARWLAALRSGKFRQGKKALCIETAEGSAYCCLGVLASIEALASRVDLLRCTTLSMLGRDDLIGAWGPATEWSSFEKSEPATWSTPQRYLAAMNDTGYSFAEIADWIEENL